MPQSWSSRSVIEPFVVFVCSPNLWETVIEEENSSYDALFEIGEWKKFWKLLPNIHRASMLHCIKLETFANIFLATWNFSVCWQVDKEYLTHWKHPQALAGELYWELLKHHCPIVQSFALTSLWHCILQRKVCFGLKNCPEIICWCV